MIGNTTIDIVKRTNTGEYGSLGTPIAAPDTYIPVPGCSLQIDTSTETHGVTNIVTVTGKAYLPVTDDTTAIGIQDGIRHGDRTYECVGPAVTVLDFSDRGHHVRCELKWQAG